MKLLSRLFRREAYTPRTHRLQLNSWSCGIISDPPYDKKMMVCLFGNGGREMEDGDFIIFRSTNGSESRYRLDQRHTPRDPGDQHFLHCSFAPRTKPEDFA